MQISSRKGLATTTGNTDLYFLQNSWKDFWPRTSDAAKKPKPTMAAGIPACGGWLKYLCLLIFNCSDYPRVLHSPNVCLTRSVCLFKINLCNGNVQPGVWVGSAEWRAGDGRSQAQLFHTHSTLSKQRDTEFSSFVQSFPMNANFLLYFPPFFLAV